MNDYVSVTVNVPADRLSEFHRMFGDWLADAPGQTTVAAARPVVPLSWDQADVDTAVGFYRGISARATKILDCWMDATKPVDADTTAAAAGLDGPYGVAGCLSSVGKASIRLNVELPFEHTAGDNTRPATYRMLASALPLFQAARSKVAAR